MEIWDIYDKNRIKTNRTHIRGEKLSCGDYILIAMVLIFNPAGQMLIQKRPPNMAWAPDMWTMTAGGAVLAGETSAQAAGRELFEELGIKIDFTATRPNFAMTNETAFIDYFLLRADIDLATLNVPNKEVAAAKWATKDEMLAMISRGQCIPYRKTFLEFCFDCADMVAP